MLKSTYAFAAAMIAAAIVALPSLSPQVRARGPVFGAKSDRIDARPLGTACSQRAWRYFEAPCPRDPKEATGSVRVMPTDRLPLSPTDHKPR